MAKTERIGVFGGTFDPIHIAHLVAASRALHECDLDRVLVMVAKAPWQKVNARSVITNAEDRFAMVVAAVGGHPRLQPCRLELDRSGLTYTADTLDTLAEQFPGAELVLICGSDTAAGLKGWHRSADVAHMASIAILGREGEAVPELGEEWRSVAVTMPSLEISSTDIRHRIATRQPVEFLVPQPVLHEIAMKGLYDEGTETVQ